MKKIITIVSILIMSFFSVNANYTKNINDEIKVYEIQKKVEKLLSKYSFEKKELFKDKVTGRIQKILGKTHNEIIKIQVVQGKEFDSFKQYVLARIYRQVKYGPVFRGTARIIENNFVKALAYDYNTENSIIFTTNNAIYEGYFKTAEFYYVPHNVSPKEFIYNKFVKQNYNGKCKVIEAESHTGTSAGNPGLGIYTIETYGEYKKEVNRKSMNRAWIGACGEYGQTNAAQYFQMISDNVLMFARPGQAVSPIDLSSIEVKENIIIKKAQTIKDYKNGLFVTNENNETCFLYKNNRLIHHSKIFAGGCLISQIEEGKSGIYMLESSIDGDSNLILIHNDNNKQYLIKAGGTIKSFELMANKRIKIFYAERSGGGTKIIDLNKL